MSSREEWAKDMARLGAEVFNERDSKPQTIWDRIVWDRGHEGRSGRIRTGVYTDLPVMLIHCDPLVLHSPGTCHFCDEHPILQQTRIYRQIGFTNSSPDDPRVRYICPALAERGENAQHWGGNKPAGTREEYEARQEELRHRLLSIVGSGPRVKENPDLGKTVQNDVLDALSELRDTLQRGREQLGRGDFRPDLGRLRAGVGQSLDLVRVIETLIKDER